MVYSQMDGFFVRPAELLLPEPKCLVPSHIIGNHIIVGL